MFTQSFGYISCFSYFNFFIPKKAKFLIEFKKI